MTTVRGTTPTITFKLPFQTSEIEKCEIYFAQEKFLFQKDTEDCSFSGDRMSVRLSQEETLMMKAMFPLKLQIRFVFTNGAVAGTKIVYTSVEALLKEGEINVSY